EGGRIAVAEAARNLTCSGARPLAVTDNLNFGNPYKPENFWQLREAVEGIAEACRAFGTPVIVGNVSLYNESTCVMADPTPTVAKLDLKLETAVQNGVRDLIRLGLVRSVHDCSEGGLAVAMVECCFNLDRLLGAEVDLENCGGSHAGDAPASTNVATVLFNETQSRIIISCDPKNTELVLSELRSKNIPHAQIGSVIADDLRITVNGE